MNSAREQPIRVFIIDDHRSVLWGLQKLIESTESRMCLIGQATRWKEALPRLREHQPDVILLDLDLGDETGLEAIPEFVETGTGRVLVLTGIRDQSIQDRAIILGARGVVEKEDSAETILTAIAKVHEGQLWLPRIAVDRILADLSKRDLTPRTTPEQKKLASLTPRELAVVEAVANNAHANAKNIASLLFISEHTLRNHLTSIYDKLGVSGRVELFAFAHKHVVNPKRASG